MWGNCRENEKVKANKNQLLGLICLFMACTFIPLHVSAQNNNKYFINQISFEGNRRTQDSTLLREMSLKVGDSLTLNKITQHLETSKSRIINTGLFTDVSTNLYFDERDYNDVNILITVKEGLFFIPIPIIELADRNFNVWWTEHDRDIKYLNLGLNLRLKNISGNADELAVLAQWGYDRKFITSYSSPYFDRDRKLRFHFDAYYASNKEVIASTKDGKPDYLRDSDNFLLSRLESRMSFVYRPYLKSSYMLTFGYYYNYISDDLFEANPDFFNNRTDQRYSQIKFEYFHERRNNKYFATEGWYLHLAAIKNGWVKTDHLKSMEFEGDLFYHYKFNDNWTWNNNLLWRLRYWDHNFPYFKMNNLGSEREYVRGYEYYHIEGNNLGIYKTGIMRKIMDRPISWGKFMPFVNYRNMNTKLFLSLNFDYGYVQDNQFITSSFVNKNLFGGGLGLNLMLYNQFACSLEVSMNQKSEVGVFFHLNQNFK